MNERVSNEQLETWLSYPDLVTTEGDLRKTARDLLDARAKIENVDREDRQTRAEIMDLECANGIKHCNPVRFRGECVYCAIEKAERELEEALNDKWKLLKIVTDKNVELLTLQREMIAWRAAIQRITPGGSEFMDPESVERWAQKQNREFGQAKMGVVKLRRELDEAGEVIEDLKADNIRLGARLDSRTESGALEYARLHDEVMRLRAAARAAGGGKDE